MRREYQILAIWFVAILLVGFAQQLPHRTFDGPRITNLLLQVLLAVMGLYIARDSTTPQRFVFLNFSIFFLYSIPLAVSSFAGLAFWSGSNYGPTYYHLFANKAGLGLVRFFVVFFGLLDFWKPALKVRWKYVTSIAASVVLVLIVFSPYVFEPATMEDHPDYVDYGRLQTAAKDSRADQLTERYMQIAAGAGTLMTKDEAAARVADLSPYLANRGATQLFWQPADRRLNTINTICFLLMLTFFAVFYRRTKPSGAYLDKTYLGMAVFILMEIVHTFGSIDSKGQAEFLAMYEIGQYFTIALLLYFVLIFDLKLNFVTSPAGRYYEHAIYTDPTKVMVFRDGIDRIIQFVFFRKQS
jgi:hypothetical protein